jgi:hypothetical protein
MKRCHPFFIIKWRFQLPMLLELTLSFAAVE